MALIDTVTGNQVGNTVTLPGGRRWCCRAPVIALLTRNNGMNTQLTSFDSATGRKGSSISVAGEWGGFPLVAAGGTRFWIPTYRAGPVRHHNDPGGGPELIGYARGVRTGGVRSRPWRPDSGCVSGCSPAGPHPSPGYSHVVVVVEENHAASSVLGNKAAPFINSLAAGGALMTRSYAVAHPSQPNYLALFAGDTFGVNSDRVPAELGDAPNLASGLLAAGHSFGGFSEGLPAEGSPVCTAGGTPASTLRGSTSPMSRRARQNPWAPSPETVAAHCLFVVPDLEDDMHDGTIAGADTWLASRIGGYAQWAKGEQQPADRHLGRDDDRADNHIATIFYGAAVRPGTYDAAINHYSVLSTIREIYGLPKTGQAASTSPIDGDLGVLTAGRVGSQRRSGPNSRFTTERFGIVLPLNEGTPSLFYGFLGLFPSPFERPRRRGVAVQALCRYRLSKTSSTGVPGGNGRESMPRVIGMMSLLPGTFSTNNRVGAISGFVPVEHDVHRLLRSDRGERHDRVAVFIAKRAKPIRSFR